MKITMTRKDRNLLIAMGCVALIILFYQLILVPSMRDVQDLQAQLQEAEGEKDMMQMQIELTDSIENNIETNLDMRTEISKPYLNQVWETRRIDGLLTDMMLANGLFPESLSLTYAEPKMIDHYVLVVPTEEEQAAQSSITPQFVKIATAKFSASGSEAECLALVDAITANPTLHMNSFNLTRNALIKEDVGAITTNSITCDIDIIMCSEGGAGVEN